MFLLDGEALAALSAAVAVHEAGHAAALLALGVRMDGISIEATGPVIYCASPQRGLSGMTAALAGPFFGALLWGLLRPYWQLAADMSAVLTVVNLLPVLPLDGGRALAAVLGNSRCAQSVMRAARWLVLLGLICCGGYALLQGWGPALLLFALWLWIADL